MADWNLKRLAHPFLRLAYRAYARWVKLKGQPLRGAAVAIWHGGKLLVVRHSYRRGFALPGGLLRQGEDPRLAACREVREEVGIAIEPEDLVLITNERVGSLEDHIYEYRPADCPQTEIDHWEIAEARFIDPNELGDEDDLVRNYLRAATRTTQTKSPEGADE